MRTTIETRGGRIETRGGRDLTRLPDEVRARLDEARVDLGELGLTTRHGWDTVEARRAPIELRRTEDGDPILDGYAAVYGVWYDVAGGPDAYGWREQFVAGAFDKTLAEKADVRFLYDHEGLVMARTASGTLTVVSDSHGLAVEARPNPRMTFASDVVSAVERGDVDQMSHAFRAVRQEWNADYTERLVIESQLFDVSAVGFPANPATVIQSRAGDPSTPATDDGSEGRLSVVLARAIADRAISH